MELATTTRSVPLTTEQLRLLGGPAPVRRPRAWRWPLVVSIVIHALALVGLWIWAVYWMQPDAEVPASSLQVTQSAYIDPSEWVEVEDEIFELEPIEIEESAALPELETPEVPDEVVLPDVQPTAPTQPRDTPALTVSPRMFERRPKPAPATPSEPVPAAAAPPAAAPAASKAQPSARPRRPRGGRVRSQFIPSTAGYYPWEARQRGIQGSVIVVVTVDAHGRVIDVQVSRSSGYPTLDQAAVRLMYDARFHPPGVESRARAPVNFILGS